MSFFLLSKIKQEADSIDFKKTVDRPVPPLSVDLLVIPIIDKVAYSRILDRKFNYWNEICISGAFYDDLEILKLEEKYIEEAFQQDAEFLYKKANLAEELGATLIIQSQKFSQLNLKKIDREKLSHAFKKYLDCVISFVPFFTFIISSGNLLEKIIKKRILKIVKDEQTAQEYTILATNPSKPNQHLSEEMELLEIAQKFHAGKKIDKLLTQHLEKYAHIGFRGQEKRFWTKNDLLQRIEVVQNPAKELNKIVENRQKMSRESNKIFKIIKADKDLEKLIKNARKYVWLRTYRSDVYNQAFGTAAQFLDLFVQKEGYKSGEYLLFSVEDFLTGKYPISNELLVRKKAFAAICINNQLYHLSGDEALEFKKFLDDKNELGDKIKGTVANRSVKQVRGVVRIVFNPKDLSKVKKGDIIVATMTTPNFVPAMKRVAGFITDEGGILCHAAIISREMNKPCIVGTGNATRVLKDGDKIIMDLEKGEVNKIK
ncbi:MAG: PEP-utilizing enzyme [Patescibacteria group bacterium]